jgi:hypothetical protein
LTAPGEFFEIDIQGVSTRIWKNTPRSLRDVLHLSLTGFGKNATTGGGYSMQVKNKHSSS